MQLGCDFYLMSRQKRKVAMRNIAEQELYLKVAANRIRGAELVQWNRGEALRAS